MTTSLLNPITPFPWTTASEKAAMLVADGQRSFKKIAEAVGVHQDTISYWLKHPDFRTRVQDILQMVREEAISAGIQTKLGRVQALQDRWQKLALVIEERGEDSSMMNVPGGPTGLLVHKVKGIGAGDNFTQIDEYEIDTGLLSEMRALEKQMAQELGEWVERQEQDHHITRVEVIYQDQKPEDL